MDVLIDGTMLITKRMLVKCATVRVLALMYKKVQSGLTGLSDVDGRMP